VTLNDRQDYFGQTVNIASRVQNLAVSRAIFATEAVVEDAHASRVLQTAGLKALPQRAALDGVATEVAVYEIP
ncbi:MAG TPA: adenylate/guanylate cyclase domain-containing protein, partial [Methylomirabilota bacterium]|nr:adenylate/guanylate cyclase domain-containing protein [Methylomirabilota bacterium]